MVKLRLDMIFSYWIFLWFIIYKLKWILYSPKFAILVSLLENFVMLIMMFLYSSSRESIIYFIIINIFLKIVPLYYLRKNNITLKDIYFTIFLFILFIIWLHINKDSLIGNLKLIHNSLLYNKNNTPFFAFIKEFKQNWKNYINPEML